VTLPEKDPNHWLYRFTPAEWLAAAENQLGVAIAALEGGSHKKGVAGARMAAGMALNALLVVVPNDHWGRSYMDHLKWLAHDAGTQERVKQAALQLLETPLEGPRFIRLGGGGADYAAAAAAEEIMSWVRSEVERLAAS